MINNEIIQKKIDDGDNKYLQLTLNNSEIVDFQLQMINNNKDRGLIEVEKSIFNTTINLKYTITGLKSLKEYIDSKESDKEELVKIFTGIANIVLNCKDILLENENFILSIDTIFIDVNDLSVKLINIPLVNTYRKNISKSYIEMISTVAEDIFKNAKIKAGSAEFFLALNNKLKEDLNISDFVEYIENQVLVKESGRTSNSTVTTSATKSEKRKNPPTMPGRPQPVSTPSPTAVQRSNVEDAVKVKTPVNEEAVEETTTTKQITRYKLGTIILLIVIQPIFIGIILCLFLINGVTTIQIAAGALCMLALDGIILKNLLDPKKKEVIEIQVKTPRKNNTSVNNTRINNNKAVQKKEVKSAVKKEEKEKVAKTSTKESKKTLAPKPAVTKGEPKVAPVGTPKPVVVPQTNINEETSMLEDETSFLSDDTTVLGMHPYLEINNGKGIGQEYIVQDSFVIGRHEQLRNWIDSTGIGRRHAEIMKVGQDYYLRDLQSKNGTKLNGTKLVGEQQEKLNDGDMIELPDLTLIFKM